MESLGERNGSHGRPPPPAHVPPAARRPPYRAGRRPRRTSPFNYFHVIMMKVEVERRSDEMVTKRATSDAERTRLAGEAAILTTVAPPGVVRLVSVDPAGELRLGAVDGGDLQSTRSLP